jgi:hypothetical protein
MLNNRKWIAALLMLCLVSFASPFGLAEMPATMEEPLTGEEGAQG